MIENELQLKITAEWVSKFKNRLQELENKRQLIELEERAVKAQLEEFESDLKEYFGVTE